MVQKLAAQGISDPRVLRAMGAVDRHRFVDSALVNQAYEDASLPIGLGQTISKPGVVSRMIELLRNGATGRVGRVLEIGTGCGYQAAVLSLVADEVYSIERLRGLHDKARENLRHLRLPNVHLLFGDGMAGYAKGAPYAGIIAAAGGEALPQAWVDQLAVGGRLVAPVVTGAGTQALLVLDKTPQGVRQTLLEAGKKHMFGVRRLALAGACVAVVVLSACSSTSVNRAPVEDRGSSAGKSAPVTDPRTQPVKQPPGFENAGKAGYYTVKPGDTLMRIGLETGQGHKDIARWN
eukprot:gene21464-41524_t